MLDRAMELCFQLKKTPEEIEAIRIDHLKLLLAKQDRSPHVDQFYGFANVLSALSAYGGESVSPGKWYEPVVTLTKEQQLIIAKSALRRLATAMEADAQEQNAKTRHASRHPKGETGHGQKHQGGSSIQD